MDVPIDFTVMLNWRYAVNGRRWASLNFHPKSILKIHELFGVVMAEHKIALPGQISGEENTPNDNDYIYREIEGEMEPIDWKLANLIPKLIEFGLTSWGSDQGILNKTSYEQTISREGMRYGNIHFYEKDYHPLVNIFEGFEGFVIGPDDFDPNKTLR